LLFELGFYIRRNAVTIENYNFIPYTVEPLKRLPLEARPPDDLDSSVEDEKIRRLKVTQVRPFGLILEDGGFIHIQKISDFHQGSAFRAGELAQWYPVGSPVLIKLENRKKLLNGKERIDYNFYGPADVIDVISENTSCNSTLAVRPPDSPKLTLKGQLRPPPRYCTEIL